MILMQVVGAVDVLGTLRTFYFSAVSYQTKPTDTPANINFEARLTDPGSIGVSVYGNGRTAGYGRLETGQIKVANKDGALDIFATYGFDGRPVVLRLYKPSLPYALMPVLFTGTVDGPPEVTSSELVFRLKDQQQRLEVPACPNLYGGTNVLPAGVDGVATDLKGKRQPRTYGVVLNITPDQVNTSLQVFRVSDTPVQDIPAVYDKGAPFTKGADYPTNAHLRGATIAAGYYATCFAEGLFRLNASIAGAVTADVNEGSTWPERTAAQIIRKIALAAGILDSEISAADLSAMDITQSTPLGIYLTGEITAREAINQIAASVGGHAIFDNVGLLRVGILTAPAGTPVLELTHTHRLSTERVAQRDGDLPIFEARLNHTKNWTVQDSDIAGSVGADRRGFLKEQWRTAPAKEDGIKLQFLLASTYEVESLIHDPTNLTGGPADLEAKRVLNLYKYRRDMFEIAVHIDVFTAAGIPRLMSLIKVTGSRYLMSGGRLFWLLGFNLELKRSRVTLTVWG